MHNLDPEGLDPYPKEMPTWAMIKYSTYTLSKIDPWPERSVLVQRRTKRPVEAMLDFHAKPGAETLQGGAGRPILGRPA